MSDADVNAKLNSIVTLLKAVGVDGGMGGKTLDDDQIQAIIRKLQNAQAEAPQIIAALEAHANRQPEPPQPQYEEEDDEEEDDDDANYPMVGPGCSDDVSIMSDLTTPTVVSSLNVPDEEHYKDTLPPESGQQSANQCQEERSGRSGRRGGAAAKTIQLHHGKAKDRKGGTHANQTCQATIFYTTNTPSSSTATTTTSKSQTFKVQ
jgi:hypothetical protein